MTQMTSPSTATLQGELQTLKRQIESSSDPSAQALLHRDAAYVALDIGEPVVALAHALACLELARLCHDLPLQIKAHVAVALVQAEAYDDLGAAKHFRHAEHLAEESKDDRGAALVAVNASHYHMERGEYLTAAITLQALLNSSSFYALSRPDSCELLEAFYINVVVSTTEALMLKTEHIGELPRIGHYLTEAAQELHALNAHRGNLTSPWCVMNVLDALTRYALWQNDLPTARQFADEFVALSKNTGSIVIYGRALLNRGRVKARLHSWEEAIQDAETAIAQFETGRHDLWAIRARETLAQVYAQTLRFREAFETQREVTQQVELLYRQFHQQQALLGQITQRAKEAEVRAVTFAEAALQDSLTGIPNRAHAMQVLADLQGRAQRGETSVVTLMDLDHFKQVNDTSGHAAGDVVLTRVAQTLRTEVHPVDSVARFGGEEFVVILRGVTLAEAADKCERLRRVLNNLNWDDIVPGLKISASFGLAVLDGHRDLKETLHAADKALYHAKASGRNVVQIERHLPAGVLD
ncbi:diguanylate cyclase [Deinococcus sp. QL22]|uniref:GGDEF domain-containing protein n=1 Tax=Deinococcus sp. QL22 TaxID=2939437 RepID=UPI002018038C|nr:tetratricopeptide repeat-containing diguanylate cyclase [Deinococcus sp. QL22]UQN09063.1 diguanylate cyclase [Deinococcus sp. QL22]